MQLHSEIRELLHLHDCVILPRFGGFVGNAASARLDQVRHRFYPPFKEISFNSNLTKNDGLLADHLARGNGFTYQDALNQIETYVLFLQSTLEEDRRVNLPGLGTLFFDQHRNLRFEPDLSDNFLPESFGLSSLQARKIVRTKAVVTPPVAPVVTPAPKAEKKEVFENRPAVAPEKKERKRRRAVYLPLAIFGLLLGSYLVWLSLFTPLFRSDQEFAFSDLNPFSEKICPEYEQVSSPAASDLTDEEGELIEKMDNGFGKVSLLDPEDENYDPEAALIVDLEEKLPSPAESTDVVSTPGVTAPNQNKLRYHLIAGCFQMKENADNLVQTLKREGNNSWIVDQENGLYRVSINSYAKRAEALDALIALNAGNQRQAWLLRK